MAQQFQQRPETQQPETQQQYGTSEQSQRYRPIGQQVRQRYEESVPSEVRLAVDDLEKVSTTAEWAKVKATQRGLPHVASVCDDIQEISELQKKLIIRQSPFSQAIGQCSLQVMQDGLQQLQQHVDKPEVQDTIEHTRQSLDSIGKGIGALQSLQEQQTGGQIGQGSEQMGRQFGGMGQQTGGQMGQQGSGMGQQGGKQMGYQGGMQQSEQFPGQQY
ncbi:hypothetical protein [Haladaptatus caseinilyticus]|uniref:hypothetical protein n=1 Tax=Haladaptatus caseinilyticus TaxID=2993314 RepID=UPI00224A92F0|nr:hypothetical protein [Haladaptatus caseinilyticus]